MSGRAALLVFLAVLAPSVAAVGQAVRTGAEAFGDWRDDAPGVVRRITPADLPTTPTRSAANSPSIQAGAAGALPRVPTGFHVERVASGLNQPRVIRTAPNGDVFLAESGAGRIRILRDAPPAAIFADGLTLPFGIAFWPPGPSPRFVYVAETNRVVRYAYSNGDQRASGRPEVIVASLPAGGHWTRDIAFSPDGKRMFVSVGSGSNIGAEMAASPPPNFVATHPPGEAWGDEEGRAAVLVADPDGRNLHPFATGLRNCVGLATQPRTGALWCVVNERDGLGDNIPPDYAASVHEGAFYGWPWFYTGNNVDTRLPSRRPDLAAAVRVPDVLIQPHSAPLGITFYDGSQFPAAYRGDAFVALHGSWNRAHPTGYKIVRLRMQGGAPTGEYEDFLTGFVVSDRAAWGRPVDVAVDRAGALLVTEDANGTVWRVTYQP